MQRNVSLQTVILLCFICGFASTSDMFSSIAELENLYFREQELVGSLERFLNRTKHVIASMEKYIAEVRNDMGGSMDVTKVTSNPINAFHLLRRTTVTWNDVKSLLLSEANATDSIPSVLNMTESFPTFDDFSGAVFALAELQVAYKLNISQFARGEVQHGSNSVFTSAKGLNARDCLFIGKHAFNKGLYNHAVEWFLTALSLARSGSDASAPLSEIEPFLKTAIRVHDDILFKKGSFGKSWRTKEEPYNPERLKNFLMTRRKQDHTPTNAFNPTKQVEEWEEMETYFQLCRGEQLQSLNSSNNLKCHILTHLDPIFFIRPLKLEEISLEPYVGLYHDFMTDSETAMFKSLAVENLERSGHGSRYGATTSDKRTSKQRWVEDGVHLTVDRITQRISAAVGLNSQPSNIGSEFYQVANYGIGGRYTPHTDHGTLFGVDAPPFEKYRGDRLLTFMTYLENVGAGGATAFTRAKVAVWPKKGAAVFWWNLFSDLEGDRLTTHGGCPVLHGSKWICNKWFHSGEQMLKRPCSIERRSRIKFPGKPRKSLMKKN